MRPPYHLCQINRCTARPDKHHEPFREVLGAEVDNPKYHRYLCRKHHSERHSMSLEEFKERYPEYE